MCAHGGALLKAVDRSLPHCRNIWKAPVVADYLESTYTALTNVGAYCMPEAHAAFFSGPSLRKVNRHPADQYFKQRELPNFQVHGATSWGTVVVISNVPDRKMSAAEARSWSQAICLCGPGLRLLLQASHIVAVNLVVLVT